MAERESVEPNGLEIVSIFRVNVADIRVEETAPQIGEYAVEARVKGSFARVITEFTIVNQNGRTFEGELEFPLPESGVVCGYAIDIDGVMTEGCIVEKEKARIAFESEVKRGADPGLVEQVSGNIYRTRIYPIPAHGHRRIRLEYITSLSFDADGSAALWLPMPSEKLAKRDVCVEVDIAGAGVPTIGGLGDKRFTQSHAVWRVEAHETEVQGSDHLLIGIPELPERIVSVEAFDGDRYFCASIKAASAQPRASVVANAWRIYWDASGSRQASDIAKARLLLEQLPESASYELIVFCNTVESTKLYTSRKSLLEAVDRVIYDGATQYCNLPVGPFEGITLFFSDGFDTLAKYPQTHYVPDLGTENVAVVVSGVKRNTPVLKRIGAGRLIDLDILSAEDALQQILYAPIVVAAVNGNLQNVEGIGEPVLGRITVLGRLSSAKTTCALILSDGRNYTFDLDQSVAASGNTLATAWAAQRIAALSPNSDDREVREELLALGRHFSIVSPVSSMIVFERLDQWVQYNIEPPKSNPHYQAWVSQNKDKRLAASITEKHWENSLLNAWKERLDWYASPIPERKTPKSGLFEQFGNAVGGLVEGAVNAVRSAVGMDRSDERARARVNMEMGCQPVGSASAFGGAVARPNATMSMPMTPAAPVASPMPAPTISCSVEEDCCDACACEVPSDGASEVCQSVQETTSASVSVSIKAWDPDTPYLQAIKDACKIFHADDAAYKAYLKQRSSYALSPSFYLDCANFFFGLGKFDTALRILSNLAELKLDDVSLLRVFAWRLREAGAYEYALSVLNIVKTIRPDEAVSWRDLALTFTLASKAAAEDDANKCTYAEKALECYHHAAFSPCERRDAIHTAVVALEEFNIFVDWCAKQKWSAKKPVIPEVDKKYLSKFDLDLRIVLMWDTDDTDIDLHVLEPSGEEVFYQNKKSASGGYLSYDVTTGYGPEEYLHKKAPSGKYSVLSNYYASHQQKLTGPTTVTATVFTNWGRPNEASQTMSLRLEKAKDKHAIGVIEVK